VVSPVEGGNVVRAQLRALVTLAERFYVASVQNSQIELEMRGNPLDPEVAHLDSATFDRLKVLAGLIMSKNVIPTQIHPPLRVGLGLPLKPTPPDWITQMYDEVETRFPTGGGARREYESSFISGSEDGILKSLALMVNPRLSVSISEDILATAIVRVLARSGYSTDLAVAVEVGNMKSFMAIVLPFMNKAGIYQGKIERRDGEPISYGSQSYTKEQMQFVSCMENTMLWEQLADDFAAGKDIDPDRLCLFLYKLSTKLEYRAGSDRPKPGEPEKFRTFMIPPESKVLLDKWVSAPFYDWMKGKYTNGIGTNWRGGGALLFAHSFHATKGSCRRRHRFWHYDCSKYDHSLKASMLTVVAMLALLAFKRDKDPAYFALYIVTCLLWAALVSGSTVHICSWIGYWRTIIGQLFSGEYDTANWNTLYHMLMWECYVLWESLGGDPDAPLPTDYATRRSDPVGKPRHTPAYPLASLLSDPCVFAKVQGDDGVCTAPLESPLCLARQRYFFRKYFDVTIKAGPVTEENDYFFTLPAASGGILREGVVFLQRRFIFLPTSGEPEIVPYRPIQDYWVRLGRATNIPFSDGSAEDNLRVMAYYRMRWVGLLYDTMETNKAAAGYIRECISWLDANNPAVVDLVEHIALNIIQGKDDPRLDRHIRELQSYALKLTPDNIGFDFARPPPPGSIIPFFTSSDLIMDNRVRELSNRIIYPQAVATTKTK
jgi:drug/metabolite transporter superfamily protein YnfA